MVPAPNNNPSQTEAVNTLVVVIEGSGDCTKRPRPPNIPYMPPHQEEEKKENGDNAHRQPERNNDAARRPAFASPAP
jgi:hypothetical protein